MTEEERDVITKFIARFGGDAGFAAQPNQPALPPVDMDADRLIGELFQRHPQARYRLTQSAFVQEAALVEAKRRIEALQAELEQARRGSSDAQGQGRGGFLGGLFGGGGGGRQPYPSAPPPPASYAPGMAQPAMMQQATGNGFLGGALTTAAGVAGGMVVGNMLTDMFSHHGGGFGGGFGGGMGAPVEETTIINNNYGDAGGDPWGGAGGDAGGGDSVWDDAGGAGDDDWA